jgi:WD40 repeat protein
MSSIFISHNSKDNQFAAKVKVYLEQIGHRSLFLDFDPLNGIPSGRNWEKELYANLRKCQVVIAICSKNFFASNWCFAEITHARALGKYIIPLRIDDCCINSILLDVQVIDVRNDLEEAFGRLKQGLKASGLDPALEWDHTRPPYPGLASFQEEDAAIYFGREIEIQKLFDVLTQFHRFGGPKLLLVLGASGSGKSSLVRAGLIPMLRWDKKSWLIIGPFRPLQTPFVELSKAIATCFEKFHATRPWQQIHELLINDTQESVKGKALAKLMKELTEISGEGEPTILLFIDQFEELLVYVIKSGEKTTEAREVNTTFSDAAQEFLFVSYLRSFLDLSNNKFLCIGTLRSDFLGNFQESEPFKGYNFDSFMVPAISREGLEKSITGPASIAGIGLEDKLADTILKDIPNTEALPLLAFTLRELWEKHGKDDFLNVDEYRNQLGGIGGAVARASEAVLKAFVAETGKGKLMLSDKNETIAQLNPDEETQLQIAFMAMVQVNEEGKFIRQLTYKKDLPASIHDLLDRFVNARLLTADEDRENGGEIIIEVTHEAIFRTWARLVNWLDENQNYLTWRKRLNAALKEWERRKKDESALLRGLALAEALAWHGQLQFRGHYFTSQEIEYITQSNEKDRAEKVEEEKRLNQLARILWDKSKTAQNENDLSAAFFYTAEGLAISKDEKLCQDILIDIEASLPQIILKNIYDIKSAVFSPDSKLILTSSDDKTVRILEVESGKPIGPVLKHDAKVFRAVFSPDGKLILTASDDHTACLLEAGSEKPKGTVLKHDAAVESAVFSPNGKLILTASFDDTVRIWEAASGKPIGPVLKHNAIATAFRPVFSPNSKWVVTSGNNHTARIWEALGGKEIKPALKHNTYHTRNPVFSRDGKLILTAKDDCTVCLWEVASGKPIGTVLKHAEEVQSAFFSPNGKLILTQNYDTVHLWKAPSGKEIKSALKHDGQISSVDFSPDSKLILTASVDRTACLWEAANGKPIGPVLKHAEEVYSAFFSPDGKLILTIGRSNTVLLWDIDSRKPIGPALKHNAEIESADFSPDSKWIVTASVDKTVRIWEIAGRKKINPILKHDAAVNSAVFSPDGKLILTASDDHTAGLWEVASGKPIGTVLKHDAAIKSAVFSPDGKLILTAGFGGTARLWEVSGEPIGPVLKHDEKGPNLGISSVAFSPDGKMVVTAMGYNVARLWEAVSGKPIWPAMTFGKGRLITSVAFSPNGKLILLVTIDLRDTKEKLRFLSNKFIYVSNDIACIWEVASGELIGSIKHPNDNHFVKRKVKTAVFSPDGKLIVTASDDHTARLWKVNGEPIGPVLKHNAAVSSAVFSPDGNWVVTASGDNAARIWEVASGKPIRPVLKHDAAVSSAVFSPDGNWVVTASDDYTVRIWEVTSGKPIGPILKHGAAIKSVVFSPDGKLIVTASNDNTTRLWEAKGDLDLPPNLFKLQVEAFTGTEFNIEINETQTIPSEQWFRLKEEYFNKAQEHYKTCRFPEQNLWARYFPNEAMKVRPEVRIF